MHEFPMEISKWHTKSGFLDNTKTMYWRNFENSLIDPLKMPGLLVLETLANSKLLWWVDITCQGVSPNHKNIGKSKFAASANLTLHSLQPPLSFLLLECVAVTIPHLTQGVDKIDGVGLAKQPSKTAYKSIQETKVAHIRQHNQTSRLISEWSQIIDKKPRGTDRIYITII
ncbi:expressed protein [Batrachochytrium dendrobatidis JAM81]|uniref:Expressed protein n=1 Tax=Batrachochytrium dendrobatidis (strain JAM81 / FGSC 10211) TaxID=684364 RepID=F4NXU2_BATDJ|nr:uncharacterized protein BATDEDRAFT_34651 [Batrachochytrium dendrobatidis JAM81]EGF81906.1 expressed protein [Batrachochytrium dendrobatidis JAM81]|eukprot:XP_006677440.1 expressed protein [Batrachochytrium dendrobatidis JAM81]